MDLTRSNPTSLSFIYQPEDEGGISELSPLPPGCLIYLLDPFLAEKIENRFILTVNPAPLNSVSIWYSGKAVT